MAPSWPRIKLGESVVYIGPKGSGKSEVANSVQLKPRRNAMIVDFKGVEDWSGTAEYIDFKDAFRARQGRYVFVAPEEFLEDKEVQSKFFKAMLQAGNRDIYLDEGYNVKDSSGLKMLATQGRASKVGLSLATQRPRGVVQYLLSECRYYFIWHLRKPEDRDYVDDFVGVDVPWARLQADKHACFIANDVGDGLGIRKLPETALALAP